MIDIEEQIRHHRDWISLIEGLFDHPSSSMMNRSIIENEHICELGRWLDEQRDHENFSKNADFQRLLIVHRDFHQTAASIMEMMRHHQQQESLELQSSFHELSSEVIRLLRLLGDARAESA